VDQSSLVLKFFLVLLGAPFAKALAYLLLADLASGLGSAFVRGTFEAKRTADWLERVVGLYLGYLAVVLLAVAQPDLAQFGALPVGIVEVAFATIAVKMLAEIAENLREAGLPIPQLQVGPPAKPSAGS
jgi:hypothetical protein